MIEEIVRNIITPIVPTCRPNLVPDPDQHETEYVSFSYTERPALCGDDEPVAFMYRLTLHYICPLNQNPYMKKKQIRRALISAGFSAPFVTNASDEDGQHYVFEAEYVDGDI